MDFLLYFGSSHYIGMTFKSLQRGTARMKFVSFLKDENDKSVTYSYHKRGMEDSYNPDLQKEEQVLQCYDRSIGNLFKMKPVSWKGEVLLDMSVDIRVDFGKTIFTDHIELIQVEDSCFSLIEIFDVSDIFLKKIGSYSSETGNNVSAKRIKISLGYSCKRIIIRINGCYKNFGIQSLDISGVCDINNTLYPIPECCTYKNGSFSLGSDTIIGAKDQNGIYAAKVMVDIFKEKFDLSLNIKGDGGNISFVSDQRSDDGYDIIVSPYECIVKSGTKLGFLYAVFALSELSDSTGIKCIEIKDKPFMNMRGVHLALPERANIPFFKLLIKNVIIPMRYNTVFLQFSGAMRYDAFPEIASSWEDSCKNYKNGIGYRPAHYEFVGHDVLGKDEVKDLCDYIKGFGLELIPEIQSWGHTQYITSAYPELGEQIFSVDEDIDLYKADAKLHTGAAHCMCPCHKDYYNVIFAIANEVLDVAKPQHYVHMGHDEIYHMAMCDKCRKIGGAKLYSTEVTKLNDFIKSKNLTMMLWADMLQEDEYSSTAAIDDLPKDIILLDFTWYFHPEKDIEDHLLKHGFKVVFGNMYSSHFPRYESRSRKDGIKGAEVSTWVYCDEKTFSYEGKMYELVYSANMMWNSRYKSDMRLSYNEIIKPIIWNLRKNLGGLDFSITKALEFPKYAHDFDINLSYAKCSFDSSECEIDITDDADIVSLIWASDKNVPRIMWKEPYIMGTLIFLFDDGSTYMEDVNYALNIFTSHTSYAKPIPSFLFRHEGYIGTYYMKPMCFKAYDGTDRTLWQHFVKMPKGKRIKRLIINHAKNTDASICIYGINCHKIS